MRGSTVKKLRFEGNALRARNPDVPSFNRYKREYKQDKNAGNPWQLLSLKTIHGARNEA